MIMTGKPETPKTENGPQTPESPKFNFNRIRMMFDSTDPELRLNILCSQLEDISVTEDNTTWVSKSTKNEDRTEIVKVSIGTKKLPKEIELLWGWGVETAHEEMIIKTAHEMAHVFQTQKKLEANLCQYLTTGKSNDANMWHYLYLYDELSSIGQVTGLATMSVYQDQAEQEAERVTRAGSTNRPFDQRIVEDITELLAAYSLGDDYFNFRLEKLNIPDGQKQGIATHVVSIFHEFIR